MQFSTNTLINSKDWRNESNVEQEKQTCDRKSNHCHILTNTKASLRGEICSETKNLGSDSESISMQAKALKDSSLTGSALMEHSAWAWMVISSTPMALQNGTWHTNRTCCSRGSHGCDHLHGDGSLQYWKLRVRRRLRIGKRAFALMPVDRQHMLSF